MESLFSQLGIQAMDFVQISVGFILTMLVFFRVKEKRFLWLNYFVLVAFGLQCVFFVLFHGGGVKLFAGLMLLSTLTIQLIVNKKRKLQARKS